MNLATFRADVFQSRRRNVLSKLFPKSSERHFRRSSVAKLDNFFFESLAALDVKCLLEAGAHEASASLRFARTGGRAIAIEANPLTFKEKTSLVSSDKIKTLNVGLGSSEGELNFFIPLLLKMAGNATFQPKSGEEYISELVSVTTIDSVVSNHVADVDGSFALWIDVEGFSREVLKGAIRTLSDERCKLIKIELEDYSFFEDQALSHEIVPFLKNYDFEPVAFDYEYEQQYNVVFVKAECDVIKTNGLTYIQHLRKSSFDLMDLLETIRYKSFSSRLGRVAKLMILSVLGETIGHKICAAFGSKSSQRLIRKQRKETQTENINRS